MALTKRGDPNIFRDLSLKQLKPESIKFRGAFGYIYSATSPGEACGYLIYAWDGTTQRLVATAMGDYFRINRAGNIDLLDDNFIKIGRDSDGTLPTPSATYRGKRIRVEGGTGVADRDCFCYKRATDVYAWRDEISEQESTDGINWA